MKKLLVMMVGLATSVFAFGEPIDLPTGTSFEGLTAEEQLDINAPDAGDESGNLFWSSEDTELDAKVTAYNGDAYTGDRPAQFEGGAQNNYLTLQTGTKTPLLRTVEPNNDGIVARDIGGGLYVDTLVKFTGCESAPEPGDDDKLIVWVKAPEDGDVDQTTNLVITAGYLSNPGNEVVKTNYIATVEGLTDFDGWHRVTVKAIADISSPSLVPGFVVFVDGKPATCAAAKGVDASAMGNLTSLAAAWDDKAALFPSMLVGDAAYQTLKAVGFEGSGAIDDVSFTDVAPTFAADEADFTLEWDANVATLAYSLNGNDAVTIKDLTTLSTKIVIPAAQANTIAVTATYAPNYVAGEWKATNCDLNGTTFTVAAGTYGASGMVVSAEDVPPIGTLKIGDNDPVPFKTLAEAFGKINEIESAAQIAITLTDDASIQSIEDNELGPVEGTSVVIDLNGNDITGEYVEGEGDYVITSWTTLTIKDTVGGGKIIPDADQLGAILNGWELTIEAVTLDGKIAVDEPVFTHLKKGGKYIKEGGNTKEELEGWLDPSADPELYVDESDATYFEVKEQEAPVVAMIEDVGYPTFAAAALEATATDTIVIVPAAVASCTDSTVLGNVYVSEEATLTIDGGTFEGTVVAGVGRKSNIQPPEGDGQSHAGGALIINAGKFKVQPSKEEADVYHNAGTLTIAAGKEWKQVEDYWQLVDLAKNFEGNSGTTYVTIADAIAAGETSVKLLDNATVPALIVDGSIEIDLNEKTLTGSGAEVLRVTDGTVSIANGTIAGGFDPLINTKDDGSVKATGGTVTLASTLTITASKGMCAWAYGGTIIVNGASLSQTGTEWTTGDYRSSVFTANNSGKITVNSGTFTSENGYLYVARGGGKGECVINGGTWGLSTTNGAFKVDDGSLTLAGGRFTNTRIVKSGTATTVTVSGGEYVTTHPTIGYDADNKKWVGEGTDNSPWTLADKVHTTEITLSETSLELTEGGAVATLTAHPNGDYGFTWSYDETSEYVGVTENDDGSLTVTGKLATVEAFVVTAVADDDNQITASCSITVKAAAPADPIPPVDPNAGEEVVNAAIDAVDYADKAAIKAAIGGDATKYNAFAAWAKTVDGGQEAVIASSYAAKSFQLAPFVDGNVLFTAEPTLTTTAIAADTETAGNWTFTVKLTNGAKGELVALLESIANCAKVSTNLETWDAATATAEINDGIATIKITPPEETDKAFMKVEVK